MRRVVALAFAALLTGNSAVPYCSDWIAQTNGVSWRVCTDAQNHRYCEMLKSAKISRIVCPD